MLCVVYDQTRSAGRTPGPIINLNGILNTCMGTGIASCDDKIFAECSIGRTRMRVYGLISGSSRLNYKRPE